MHILELTDLATERDIWPRRLGVVSGERNDLVPTQQALDAILRVSQADKRNELQWRYEIDPLPARDVQAATTIA